MDQTKDNLITRRDFLKLTSKTGTGLFLLSFMPLKACTFNLSNEESQSDGENQSEHQSQLIGRVVHTYSSNATDWDFGADYYGNHVNQSVIDDMVNQGIQQG